MCNVNTLLLLIRIKYIKINIVIPKLDYDDLAYFLSLLKRGIYLYFLCCMHKLPSMENQIFVQVSYSNNCFCKPYLKNVEISPTSLKPAFLF
jgi:hypothetical protein